MEKFEAFGFIATLVTALSQIKSSQMVHEKRIKYLMLLIENFSFLIQIKMKPLVEIFYCDDNKEKGKNFVNNLVDLLLFEDEGVQIQVFFHIIHQIFIYAYFSLKIGYRVHQTIIGPS